MTIARMFATCLVLVTATARAGTVGVVVTGEDSLKASVRGELEAWLTDHAHTLQTGALGNDAITTIENCLQLQDHECARKVVEERGKTDSIVFAHVEKSKLHAIVITVYWILKGHEVSAERRVCEDCSPDVLHGTVDAVMQTVSSATVLDRGRLHLESKPNGVTVVLDQQVIGVTPVERDLPAGKHTIVLMKGTQKVGERTITIHPSEDAEITMPWHEPPPPPTSHRRLYGGVLLGLGSTAIATGAVLFATSEKDDGTKPYYRNSRPAGLIVGGAGLAVAAVGAYLWFHGGGSPDSAPVAAIDAHGGIVGWSHAF